MQSTPESTVVPPALVIVSHGSQRPGAVDALLGHCAALRSSGRYCAAEAGFVNAGSPAPAEAVQAAVTADARTVLVIPYFLDRVRTVQQDMPRLLEESRAHYPAVQFHLSPVIGESPLVAGLIVDLAGKACQRCDALVLAVHGSQGNAESGGAPSPIVRRIETMVRSQTVALVRTGYLEQVPAISSALDNVIRDGARRVVCVPLFLLGGNHVARDIPAIIEETRQRHPAEIYLADYLGSSPRMVELLGQMAAAGPM